MQIQNELVARLQQCFEPSHLEVVNESHQHNVPPGSESHFKVTVVSSAFQAVRKVKRHQMVYSAVGELIGTPIHALAIHTFDVDEWSQSQVPASPNCLGGGR